MGLRALGTTLCGLLWLAPSAWAQVTLVDPQGTLKGLPGVRVLVEDVKDVTKGMVTKDLVQTDVELRLRQLGIKVFSTTSDMNAAFLHVDVSILKEESSPADPLFIYGVEVAVQQVVRLERASTVQAIGTTWKTRSVGFAATSKLDNVRRVVIDAVDEFANVFLSANQK